MNRRLATVLLAVLVSVLAFALPTGGHAQSAGRARVRGEISGLELALDGGLSAPRGGTLRFVGTLYEVVGLSTLRIARNARVEMTSALDPTAEPTTVTTDAQGRATLELAIPEDADAAFGIVIRAVSGAVQRRFELTVSTYDRRQLVVLLARSSLPPGSGVPVAGLLWDGPSDRPVAGETVRLTLRDEASRTMRPPVSVTTDASGLFSYRFALPPDARSSISVLAEVRDEDGDVVLSSNASAYVTDPASTPLLVAVAPLRTLVEPGASVPVDVVVRTGEGRPVEGTTVTIDGLAYDDPGREQRTDARGRARFTWRAPDWGAAWSDVGIGVSAAREGIGSGYGSASVRVARVERAASFAVEGGSLVPSLGGRIFVRVVTVDGQPAAAGVAVELTGPRLGTLGATTDASGIAVFDVTLHDPPAASRRARRASADDEDEGAVSDLCGGEAATSISIHAAGASVVEACLPLDPDGTVRVRASASRVDPGASVELELARSSASARLPVAVTLLSSTPMGLVALAQRVVPAGDSRVSIPVPNEAAGEPILVRARPLFGTELREVRGGTTMVWVSAAPWDLDLTLGASGASLTSRPGTRAFVVALPLDEAGALVSSFGNGGTLSELMGLEAPPSSSFVDGALAARTTRDVGAPFVLRGATTTPVPAPPDAVSIGLLRDPWRSQSRFVTGRLALVFSAVEQQVAGAVPERIEDVAVETTPGHFDFNAQILSSIADSGLLGAEGATGLGGEDLTVAALRAFDGAFTYDNVARRVTRERLFRIMVALRTFVQQNGFDLPWARLGEPSTWLSALPEIWTDAGSVQPRDLVDGWGRPFVLRRVTGRARFTGWSPLDGWEVLSTGPDGRAGNGDDLFDPTARVLPSGSPYAQAVGEDALVARLRGVELGRATVELLASFGATEGYVDGVPYSAEDAGASLALSAWTSLPSPLAVDLDPLALRRPDRPADVVAGRVVALDGTPVPLPFDEEPRTWGVVAVAIGQDGTLAVARASTLAGAPVIVEGDLPSRVRVDEPIEVPLVLTNVADRARTLAVEVSAEGPLEASGGSSVSLEAGSVAPVSVRLSGRDTGEATLIVRVTSGSETLRTLRVPVSVDAGRHPIRTRAAGFAGGGRDFSDSMSLPGSADDVSARLVLLAPSGLAYDPDLAETRESDPALLAWSLALAGRPLDDELRARLLRSQQYDGSVAGTEGALSTACALVAWSAAEVHDAESAAARDRARTWIAYASPVFYDADTAAGSVRGAASLLIALAPGGVYDPADGSEAAVDPVARFSTQLRSQLWRTLRSHPGAPSVLARAAAALLLVDPEDARGLAMYERARAAVGDAPGGALVSPGEDRSGTYETLTASLALAIAAHQVGDDELARRLVRAVAWRDNLITARGGELLFYWLAAGAYGVLGTGEPVGVRAEAGGASSEPTFSGGIAVVPVTTARAGGGLSARVSASELGPMVLARLETVYTVPLSARSDGAFHLALNGDPGSTRRIAALELSIEATESVSRPILYVQLPAGVPADDTLMNAIRGAAMVIGVEERRPGFLRITLGPMGAGETRVIPLPVCWDARGSLHGLGAIAHPADDPGRMTVLEPTPFTIE